MARAILGRFRYSNEEIEHVVALVAHHMQFPDTPHMRPSTLKRFLRMPQFEEHMSLHRLDCLSSHRRLQLYDFCRQQLEAIPAEELRPKPLLNGKDLIAAGYTPGPEFSKVLSAVEDAQLDFRVNSKEEALTLARGLFQTE